MDKQEFLALVKQAGFKVWADGRVTAADNGVSGSATESLHRLFQALAARSQAAVTYELALEEIANESSFGFAQEIAISALNRASIPELPPEEPKEDAAEAWRRLALQFDEHRMQALGHLRMMLVNPKAHAGAAASFLAAPPLSGVVVLEERVNELVKEKLGQLAGHDHTHQCISCKVCYTPSSAALRL